MERDKRKLEAELERQRQTIGKQVFLQVVQQKGPTSPANPVAETTNISNNYQLASAATQSTKDSMPRRQWDRSNNQKGLLDLEGEALAANVAKSEVNTKNASNSTSSMSTPSSSASQSPPILNVNNNNKSHDPHANTQQNMSVDLSKAYYSRDEVLKAINSLKEQYGKEANAINTILMSNTSSKQASSAPTTSNNNLSSSTMVKEIEMLNNKLGELQSEINRLTLVNQATATVAPVDIKTPRKNDVAHLSNIIPDEKKNLSGGDVEIEEKHSEGSFFISIGDGAAKREKPPSLTPKKNLIFVKSKSLLFSSKLKNIKKI